MTSFNETSLSRFPNKFQGTKELKVSSFAEYINTFSTPLASVYTSVYEWWSSEMSDFSEKIQTE